MYMYAHVYIYIYIYTYIIFVYMGQHILKLRDGPQKINKFNFFSWKNKTPKAADNFPSFTGAQGSP